MYYITYKMVCRYVNFQHLEFRVAKLHLSVNYVILIYKKKQHELIKYVCH